MLNQLTLNTIEKHFKTNEHKLEYSEENKHIYIYIHIYKYTYIHNTTKNTTKYGGRTKWIE